MTKSYLDQLTYDIIGADIEVHDQPGPGLLESIRDIPFKTEMVVPVIYDQQKLETVLRCDLYVANSVVWNYWIHPKVFSSILIVRIFFAKDKRHLLIHYIWNYKNKNYVPYVPMWFYDLSELVEVVVWSIFFLGEQKQNQCYEHAEEKSDTWNQGHNAVIAVADIIEEFISDVKRQETEGW